MSRLGAVMYGVVIAGIAVLFRGSIEPSIWLFQERAGDRVVLAVTGWLIATLGPIALSVCVWLVVRRLKARWILHLVFIPTSVVIFKQGVLLFFYGTKVAGEGSLEGFALLMATAFLLLTALVHTVALIVESYKTIKHRANGS